MLEGFSGGWKALGAPRQPGSVSKASGLLDFVQGFFGGWKALGAPRQPRQLALCERCVEAFSAPQALSPPGCIAKGVYDPPLCPFVRQGAGACLFAWVLRRPLHTTCGASRAFRSEETDSFLVSSLVLCGSAWGVVPYVISEARAVLSAQLQHFFVE